jgi:DNA polymerase III alpha subunit
MLDALQSVDDLFDLVNLKGQKALAITDHGTLAALFDAYKAYKRTGVKFIPGCEAYFVHSYDIIEPKKGEKGRKKTEKRKHMVLLAQNETGYKNLLKINYLGFQHFVVSMGRVFPRISWEILEEYNEGIIATSACANGILAEPIFQDDYKKAVEYAKRFADIFKGRFYLEIQPHALEDDRLSQVKLNNQLIKMSKELDLPLVTAVDAHYLTKSDATVHDVLMAINAKKPVDDPDRHRYGINEFYVKDGDEVYDFLAKFHGEEAAEEAVSNTVKIADMIEPPDYMESKGNHLPVFDPSKEPDYKEFLEWREKSHTPENLPMDKAYMRFHIIDGFKRKFGHLGPAERKERWDRVKNELKILEGNNFSSYMLITADMIKWAKKNDILVGIGRGCLSGDTMVFTSDGFKRLDKIVKGDVVLTHKGRFRSVKDTFKYDVSNEDLVQVRTDYSFGPITLTNDHEVYGTKKRKTKSYQQYLNNNWKPPFKRRKYFVKNDPSFVAISELNKDDFIFMPFPDRPDHDIESLDLGEYCGPNDILDGNNIISMIPLTNNLSIGEISKKTGLSRNAVQRAKRNNKILVKTRLVISDYLAQSGVSFDDWQNSTNTENREIGRYLEIDEDFCYMIGRWIGDGWIHDKNQSYSIGFAFHRDDVSGKEKLFNYFSELGFKCTIAPHKEKKIDQLYVYSYILAKLFRDLFPSYQDTSSTKSFGIFSGLPSNKTKQIIMGIKHSDGHYNIERDKRENIDSTSINLINNIRQELLYLKIPSSVSIRKSYKYGEYVCKKSYKLRFRGIEGELSNRIDHRIFENGYYVTILDKKQIKKDFVYDIHVDEDKSYVTQNYAVHNSVGGSLIAHLLGIHNVDPLEYGLLFERFQNAYKTDLPDIDTDFTSNGRDNVQEYVREKYGRDNCAQVSNINTYTPKNVIPDLVKSMRNVMPGLIPEGAYYVKIAEAIKAAIPDQDPDGNKVKTLERAMELSPKLRDFADRCPELMECADKIVGMPKEYSTHAAGMVVSDVPIYEFAPLRIDKNREIAVQYEKNRCESEGLVKMDFLAISTLDVIDETFKNIRSLGIENAPRQMEDIPLDDPATYEMIQRGQTKCVFQLGKSGIMAALCKRIKPKNILDIAMVNALGRPAAKGKPGEKGTREEYIDRRTGKDEVTYPHISLEKPLGETYGLAITEEQLMGVAGHVAGWDLNKADKLRKFTKIKGKDPDFALKLEAEFIEGMMNTHGVDYELAKGVWDKYVAGFGGYGFNKTMHKDTLVYTTSGTKKMSECKVGDKLYSLDDGKVVVSNITNIYDHGIVPLWKLTFNDGSVERCTLDHKWIVNGERITTRRILEENAEIDSISVSGLPSGISLKSEVKCSQKNMCRVLFSSKNGDKCEKSKKVLLWRGKGLYKSGMVRTLPKMSNMSESKKRGSSTDHVEGKQVGHNEKKSLSNCEENILKKRYTTKESRSFEEMETKQSRGVCKNIGKGAQFSKEIKDGNGIRAAFAENRVQKKRDDFVWLKTETSRFCQQRDKVCDRDRWSLAFPPNQGRGSLENSTEQRLYIRDGDQQEGMEVIEDRHGSVPKIWQTIRKTPGYNYKNYTREAKQNILSRKVIQFSFEGFDRGLDIEVDNESHNFLLASGIFTSNSHAVFYSINGYITAYLKCHYPAAFLAAYLKVKTSKGGINKDDEINGAKGECRRLGIRIIPPDINKSKAGYEVLDDQTVVMGLAAIKGMGAKALDEVISKQPFSSFVNFLHKVDGRIINKSKIEALAKAGCFDSFKVNRKDVHDEGKKIRDKMNAFLRKKIKDGYDAEMAIEDFPLKFSGNEWGQQEKLRYEQEVLGELVSGNIHDLFPRFFTNNGVTLISKLRVLPNRHRIVVEVIVKSFLREFKIKNGKYAGQKMAKYLVEDVMGTEVELTVWPTEYKTAKDLMTIGRPVGAICEVSDFNGAKTLMLKELQKVYGN